MKILYVCDALAIYGGLERVLIEKANWLVEHGGYEVCLLTINQGNHPFSFPLHPDVLYTDLDIRFYLQYHQTFWKRASFFCRLHRLFREKLFGQIKEFAPDIIICTRLDYIRDVLKVKSTVPLIFESHSSRLASRFEGDGMLRRLHVWRLQLAVKKVQMVVALTNGDAKEWKKLTPNVCVIPNVVHLNDSGTYSDCTSKSAIFVGRFSKQKDVRSLLHIWNHVHQRHPDWCLNIYGGYGEEREVLLAEIKRMDANIQVHEPTSDIMEKYKENSILLLTSLYEPFGLVLPEAMSCGLPVVAFDCSYGPIEVITNNVDGFLIMDRNIESFVDNICQLIDNVSLRQKVGKTAIASSLRYKVDSIMSKWNNLFEKIVGFSE